MVIASPDDGTPIEIPSDEIARYEVQRDWLEERLLRVLSPILKTRALTRLHDDLVGLGTIAIDGAEVSCYLARRLADPMALRQLDGLLRGRREFGVGLIFSAGSECPLALGTNVVVALADHLDAAPGEGPITSESLIAAYRSGRQQALGGSAVTLLKHREHAATLYIPGKPAYSLGGVNQIRIFERLVYAYQGGVPAVPTKELMADLGCRSPRQAFRDWEAIVHVYIGQAAKRGSWQLLA